MNTVFTVQSCQFLDLVFKLYQSSIVHHLLAKTSQPLFSLSEVLLSEALNIRNLDAPFSIEGGLQSPAETLTLSKYNSILFRHVLRVRR